MTPVAAARGAPGRGRGSSVGASASSRRRCNFAAPSLGSRVTASRQIEAKGTLHAHDRLQHAAVLEAPRLAPVAPEGAERPALVRRRRAALEDLAPGVRREGCAYGDDRVSITIPARRPSQPAS